jgi:hypothetical protein
VQDLKRDNPLEFGYLNSSFVLGTAGVQDVEESRMTTHKQRQIIDGYDSLIGNGSTQEHVSKDKVKYV